MYKLTVKGKGFESFRKAYKDGAVGKLLDEIFIGIFPFTRRYEFLGEHDGKLEAIDDPVMAFSYDVKELIGNKRWKAKRHES